MAADNSTVCHPASTAICTLSGLIRKIRAASGKATMASLAATYDAGRHWEQVNNIPLGQFYHVSADAGQPFYNVTFGMQDNGVWTGPSRTREPAGIFNDDWRMISAFTGFNSLADPDNPDIILSEQPGGALIGVNMQTREAQTVSPQPESYSGAPASEMKYRFNWDAPLVRSPYGERAGYLSGR